MYSCLHQSNYPIEPEGWAHVSNPYTLGCTYSVSTCSHTPGMWAWLSPVVFVVCTLYRTSSLGCMEGLVGGSIRACFHHQVGMDARVWKVTVTVAATKEVFRSTLLAEIGNPVLLRTPSRDLTYSEGSIFLAKNQGVRHAVAATLAQQHLHSFTRAHNSRITRA